MTASHTFSRLLQKVVEPKNNVVGYFDDILVASSNLDEHHRDLQNIFRKLLAAGLCLNKDKCMWAVDKVNFLGYEISENTVKPDARKSMEICKFPRPTDVNSLKRFLGMVSYYRAHIRNLSVIAEPLYKLTEKNQQVCWDLKCNEAYKELQISLSNPPVRQIPDPNKGFQVSTDACNDGIGGVLEQLDENGNPVVIEYTSKQFDNTQKKMVDH